MFLIVTIVILYNIAGIGKSSFLLHLLTQGFQTSKLSSACQLLDGRAMNSNSEWVLPVTTFVGDTLHELYFCNKMVLKHVLQLKTIFYKPASQPWGKAHLSPSKLISFIFNVRFRSVTKAVKTVLCSNSKLLVFD